MAGWNAGGGSGGGGAGYRPFFGGAPVNAAASRAGGGALSFAPGGVNAGGAAAPAMAQQPAARPAPGYTQAAGPADQPYTGAITPAAPAPTTPAPTSSPPPGTPYMPSVGAPAGTQGTYANDRTFRETPRDFNPAAAGIQGRMGKTINQNAQGGYGQSAQGYNQMNDQRIRGLLESTPAGGWGGGMQGDPITQLMSYGVAPHQLANNPEALAAAKQSAQGQAARAKALYDEQMARDYGVNSLGVAPDKSQFQQNYDQQMAQLQPWLV